jgi:serine/threonine protein kinase
MPAPTVANETALCPTCGGQLLPDVPFGLCLRCLVSLGFERKTDGDANAPEAITFGDQTDGFDYEVIERIGRGGMGIVYRARQRSLDRIVALKMIAMGDSASQGTYARFRREAEMAAKLDHPNIVSIIEVGEFQANPFLVMRFVQGDDLAARMPDLALPADAKGAESHQAQTAIARLIAIVARAVDFAHTRGVLHRDLKPSNILLDQEDRPHLTDFGIAKTLDQDTGLTQTAELLGTLCYMSPEQAAGKATSRAADIYSLGAILYELLTRQRPFEGAKMEVLHHVLHDEPAPPRSINPTIERDLATICLKCLDKNPLRRYASALALAEDLERWSRREPILAREAGPLIRVQRWTARNPAVATLLVTLSAGIVISLTLLARANQEKFRKSIALDILRTESARQLQELWYPTRAYFPIESETLSAMTGMEVSSLQENEQRLSIAMVAEANPLARVLHSAPMLSQIETSVSDLVQKPTRFDLRIYKDPNRAIEDLARGKVDFAQLNARQFIRARTRDANLKALLRIVPSGGRDGAVMFTRQKNGIHSISDLRGHSILFGPADSTMTFWTKAALNQAGIQGADLAKYRYSDRRLDISAKPGATGDNTGNSYGQLTPVEAVVSGLYDAAVMREKRFQEVANEQGLVALHRFEDSGDVLVARGNLSTDLTTAFRRVMLNNNAEAAGPLLLGEAAEFQSVTDDGFDGIIENLDAETAFAQ